MHMQHLKLDNSIRKAIDEMQEMPEGFVFNSQGAWLGIEQKLPQKTKSIRKGYFAAAAVILLMAANYFIITPTPAHQKQLTQKTNDEIPSRIINKEPTVVNNQEVISKKLSLVALKKNTRKTLPVSADSSVEPITALVSQDHAANAAIETIPTTDKTEKQASKELTVTTTVKQLPKKYKIVHINELNPAYSLPSELKNLSKYDLKKNEVLESTTQPAENITRQLFFFKKVPSTNTTISISEN